MEAPAISRRCWFRLRGLEVRGSRGLPVPQSPVPPRDAPAQPSSWCRIEETLQWIPASWRSKAVVAPNAIVDAHLPERVDPDDRPPTALFAGELIPLKGLALAIRAIAGLPEWRLLICGKGRDEQATPSDRASTRRGEAGSVSSGSSPGTRYCALMAEEADVLLVPQPARRGTHGGGRSAHRRTPRGVSGSRRSPEDSVDRRPRGDRAGKRPGDWLERSCRHQRTRHRIASPSTPRRERFSALLRSRGLLETRPDHPADPVQT